MTTTTATVDPTTTSTTTPKKKRNKRKLPVRNIIDAELVTIDTKKSSNSNTNAQQREMDDLLLSSQRDRTILSDLWNNTITTGRPSNSDKPRVIIGTPTHKKVKQPSTDPDTTDKATASAAVEEKKALTSSSIKKKDILKEKLKKELQNKKSDSVLDLSGHTIIPLTLQKDMSSKVAKEKATMKSRRTQQQQQKEEKDYHDDAPSYDYDDYDTTALLNNNTTNGTTTTSSNTTNDTSTKHSNKDVKVDSSNIMDHDIQAVVVEEEEGQKDKQVNEETKPEEAHVEEEKEKVEKADDSNCVASQKVETAAQTEKVDNVNEAIEEQAVDIVDKETVDKPFNTDSDKEQKSSSDEKKELHESTATITETCSIQPNVQPGIVTLEEAKQNLQECEQNIEIPTKAPPICNNLTINKVHKAQEQDDDDGEEEEEEEQLSWMKQKDDENDVNQAQDDVYQNIFNLMSKKPSVTTKKRKAEQIESGSLSKRLKMLRASKRLDWLENAADNNTNNNIKIQKKERAKIQTRKDRLQDKLEQPYIIKKRIKSVWFVQ